LSVEESAADLLADAISTGHCELDSDYVGEDWTVENTSGETV